MTPIINDARNIIKRQQHERLLGHSPDSGPERLPSARHQNDSIMSTNPSAKKPITLKIDAYKNTVNVKKRAVLIEGEVSQ